MVQDINKRKKQQKKHEKGRSMVEMLGVIGVIALLTIVGIMGYRYAIGAYQAGTIVEAMTKLKTLVVTKQINKEEDVLIFLEKTPVNSYNPQVAEESDVLQVNIDSVAASLCGHILKAKAPFSVTLKGNSWDENQGMSFIFDDLNTPGNENTCSDRCGAGETTKQAVCGAGEYAQKTSKTSCGKPCYRCVNDACPSGTSSFCPSAATPKEAGKTPSGMQCYVCLTGDCPAGSQKSCPGGQFSELVGHTGSGEACYKCIADVCAAGTVLSCSAGLQSVVAGQTPSGKQCYRCVEETASHYPNPITTTYITTKKSCDITYENRIEQARQYCRNKGSFLLSIEDWGCAYDKNAEGGIITGMSCNNIPAGTTGRFVVGKYPTANGYDQYNGCEALWELRDKFLWSYGSVGENPSQALCASDLALITTNGTAMVTTTYKTTYETTTVETTTGSSGYRCPDNKPLIGGNDSCYACNVYEQISYSEDVDCSRCPGLKVGSNGYGCVSATDCTNKPLKSQNGECFTCDDPQGIFATNCSVCGDQRVQSSGGRCYLKTACGANTFETKDGLCHRCDTENITMPATPAACSNCGGQRVYSSDGYCCKACPSGYRMGTYCGCIKN